MRLMDLLADAREALALVSDDGCPPIAIAGAAGFAEAVQLCPMRYVLDDAVTNLCERLLETDAGMLDPANSFLRLPATSFWLEWYRDASLLEGRERQKLGCLIEGADDGRSGTLHHFWIDELGKAQSGQVRLEFNLDSIVPAATPETRRLNHDRAEFQLLLNHVIARVTPNWLPYFNAQAPTDQNHFIAECAERVWFDLPMILAFAALLGAGSYMTATSSDLRRLNKQREARGRPALLDHVETRLSLNRSNHGNGARIENRAAPRLHNVRGHMVHRHGKSFWRMTHLRGDPAAGQIARTVRVCL